MTRRMVTALADPHLDILGHCTGRMKAGRRNRPPSTSTPTSCSPRAARFDKAVEINSRPERLDPPKRLLRLAVEAGCKVSIDSDAHAPGQMAWQPYGCDRAAACGVQIGSIVNALEADALLAWAARMRLNRPPIGPYWPTHRNEETTMSVARVTELSCTSPDSFEDAIRQGIERANRTLRQVRSAWVKEQRVNIGRDGAVEFQANILVTFVLED